MKPSSFLVLVPFVLALGCGDDGGSFSGDLSGGDATVFGVATDFMSAGVASTIALPSLDVTANAIDGVASSDPVVRRLDQLYVVNRAGADNVTIVDPDTLELVEQFSTGGGSNPQDVALLDDKLYVVSLASADIAIFDAADPTAGPIDTISLAEIDAEDGLPDCNSIVALGDRLIVSCGVFDDAFVPRGDGVLAIVDPIEGVVANQETLPYANPIGFLRLGEGALDGSVLVATAPNFGDLTEGCVAGLSIGADGEVDDARCVVDNADLGGYASGIAVDGDAVWLAVVSGFDLEDFGALGGLRRYDAGTEVLGPVTSPVEHRVFDVAACPTGDVAVADAAGGVLIYDAEGAPGSALLDIGLPPVQMGLTCY